MADISTTIAGMELENPTMLASGILGQTGQSLLRIMEHGGAGAVVTKSIGLEPGTGHGNPSVLELDNGLLNAMGLPNPGIDAFGTELRIALKGSAPVIGSIFADSGEGFAMLAARMDEFGAHAVELNLSCPHATGYGLEMGSDPDMVGDIVGQVKRSVKIPVLAKLSPMVPNIGDIAAAVQDAGGGEFECFTGFDDEGCGVRRTVRSDDGEESCGESDGDIPVDEGLPFDRRGTFPAARRRPPVPDRRGGPHTNEGDLGHWCVSSPSRAYP
jgi:hypothetical protein